MHIKSFASEASQRRERSELDDAILSSCRAFSYLRVVFSARRRKQMSFQVYKSRGGWPFKGASRTRSKSAGRRKTTSRYVLKSSLPKQVMNIVNQKAEIKHKGHEYKSLAADSDGDIVHVSDISDGAAVTERIGENIMVAGYDLWGFWNNDDTTETAVCRIILFRYNHQHITTPPVSEVLAITADNRAPNSLYNTDYTGVGSKGSNNNVPAITILHDETVCVGPQGVGSSKAAFRITKRWKPWICKYGSVASTDEGPGQLYVLYNSNVTAPATTCQLNAVGRVYFTDV